MRNENALAGQPIPKFHSPNAQSDEALMKAIAAGDQGAMRTLYARHNVRLYHFIARLVTDAGRAEDLVSEVFIDVWRQADRFEGRSQVSTWILSIARFKTLSALHRRRDTQIDDIDMELIEDSANTPEEVVLNRDRSAQLRICLAQMSRDHREILDLVYYRYYPGSAAHERRRDSARFDGWRDRASMMFQPCFLAVETKERISAKSIAPCNDRKPPEIFCRSFIMRPPRSA
jgi:RNA polymerase sigma-70 factor, ECF subfamily